MKDRLSKILNLAAREGYTLECEADVVALAGHLVDKGVLFPPCKIGDLLFCIISDKSCTDDKVYQHIEACRVEAIMYFGEDSFLYSIREINNGYRHNTKLGKDAFRSFEEAEKVLAERSKS